MPDRAGCGKLTPIESRRSSSSQGAAEQVREVGTGMPDEAGYIGHLVAYEIADQLLNQVERLVLTAARNEWLRSIEIDEHIRAADGAGTTTCPE
jgi:hypothetical protein